MKKLTFFLSVLYFISSEAAIGQSGLLIGGDLRDNYLDSPGFIFTSRNINLDLGYQIGREHQIGTRTSLVSSDSDLVEDGFRFNGVYYNYLYWINDKIAISSGLDFQHSDRGNAVDVNGGILMRISPSIDMNLGVLNGPIWSSFNNEFTPSPTIINPNPNSDYILVRQESNSLGLLRLFNNLKVSYRAPKWKDGFDDYSDYYPRKFVSVRGNFSNATSHFQNINDPSDEFSSNSKFRSFELNTGFFTVGKFLVGAKFEYTGNTSDSFESKELTIAPLIRINHPIAKNIAYYGQLFGGPTFGLGSDDSTGGREGGIEGGLVFNIYRSLSLEMKLIDFGISYNSTTEIFQTNALILRTDNLLGVNVSF